MPASASAPILLQACPLCSARDAFVPHGSGAPDIAACRECGLVVRNPQPSDETLRAIYGPGYFFGAGDREMEAATSALKSATADLYLDAIDDYRGGRVPGGARLLDVGCGHGDLLARARARGYEVHGMDVSEDAVRRVEARLGAGTATREDLDHLSPQQPFDVCVLSDVIEHARDPEAMVRSVRRMLKHDGTIFISTPSVAHWSARLLRRHWMEFKEEHLFYFAPGTIRALLAKAGFERIVVGPSWKRLNLDYVGEHFRRFHVPLLEPAVRGCRTILPGAMRRRPFSIRTGGIVVLARPGGDAA